MEIEENKQSDAYAKVFHYFNVKRSELLFRKKNILELLIIC